MQKASIQLETLTCPTCGQKIENSVKNLNGVVNDSVKVLFNSSKVKLIFDESIINIGKIEKAIVSLGYEIKKTQVNDL